MLDKTGMNMVTNLTISTKKAPKSTSLAELAKQLKDQPKTLNIAFPTQTIIKTLTSIINRFGRFFLYIPEDCIKGARNALHKQYSYGTPPDGIENIEYKNTIDLVWIIWDEIYSIRALEYGGGCYSSSESISSIIEISLGYYELNVYERLRGKTVEYNDLMKKQKKLEEEFATKKAQPKKAAIKRHEPKNIEYQSALNAIRLRVERGDKPHWKHNDYVDWELKRKDQNTGEKKYTLLSKTTLRNKTAKMFREMGWKDLVLGDH